MAGEFNSLTFASERLSNEAPDEVAALVTPSRMHQVLGEEVVPDAELEVRRIAQVHERSKVLSNDSSTK